MLLAVEEVLLQVVLYMLLEMVLVEWVLMQIILQLQVVPQTQVLGEVQEILEELIMQVLVPMESLF